MFAAPFIGIEDVGEGLLGPLAGIDLAPDISVTYTVDGTPGIFDGTVMVVPEPSSLMLAALGLVSLAACGWRRRPTNA